MSDRRLNLSPYVGKRLLVEGILIDIDAPNKKNDFKFGLVFASVQLPNEKIELDHVIIPVGKQFIEDRPLTLFQKYRFTAVVDTYEKKQWLCGVQAYVKAYQLDQINAKRFDSCSVSNKKIALSLYLTSRIDKIIRAKVPINIDELTRILLDKKEGEREQYLNQLTTTLQKKTTVTRAKLLNELYKKEKIGKKQR